MSDYIPPELIPNILARLSVDDVLRCTSVCKSWYELITSPSFVSLHLNLSSANQEPRMLFRYNNNRDNTYYLHRDNETFDEVVVLDPHILCHLSEVDCINGLLCFSNVHLGAILLWNPLLKKLVILPKHTALSRSQSNDNITVGFGFVASSNEYKIVNFSYDAATQCGTAEIYELSTGSWRDLNLEGNSNVNVEFRQAHLNGILHWFKRSPEQGDPSFSSGIYKLLFASRQ